MEHQNRKECDLAIAIASSSKVSDFKYEHSLKTRPLKHQDDSIDVIQERNDLNEDDSLHFSEFTKNKNKDIRQIKYSKYIILEFLQDRVLVTFNNWNGIVENTFCNTCKFNFIRDTKSHCNEMKHIMKMTQICYELSDGSIARKFSKSRIVCLVCDSVIRILKLNEHIQTELHLNNLNNAKTMIAEIQPSQQNRLTSFMHPVVVHVTHIQKKVSICNQEESSDEYVLLEFGNSKLMLTYNSWNGIVINRMTCHVCGNKYIMSNIESINEHCNEDKHKMYMGSKIIQANFTRYITRIRIYCIICSFICNSVQMEEHIGSKMHKINLKSCRKQAASRAGSGIEIINCLDNFQQYDLVNRPVQTPSDYEYVVHYNSKESVASENCGSEDISRNGDYVDSGLQYITFTKKTNNPISVACQSAGDDKVSIKRMRTVEVLISSNSTAAADDDNGQFSTTNIEFPQNTEKCIETANLLISSGHEDDNNKESMEFCVTTSEALSAVPKGNVRNVATEKINVDSGNSQASSINSARTEFCHICRLAVPLQFYTEHLKSKFHKQMTELTQTVLGRIKNGFDQIYVYENKCDVLEGVQYCSTCNCLLRDEEFSVHSNSDLHKHNEGIGSVIERAVCVLQPSGNDQLITTDLEVFAPIKSTPQNDAKITTYMETSEEVDELQFNQIKPNNVEKPQNGTDCRIFATNNGCVTDKDNTNQSNNIQEEVDSDVSYSNADAAVVESTNSLVTLQVEERKINIDILSYHGVYPKPGNTLWCVLCKVKVYDLSDHFMSGNHVKRLGEMKFKGVDLIRYLSTFQAHCGLCHVIVNVSELEEHMNSETHKGYRASATIDSEKKSVQDDCAVKSIDLLSVQSKESNKSEIGQMEMTNYVVFNDKNFIGYADKVNMSTERNSTTDTISQLNTNTETNVNKRQKDPILRLLRRILKDFTPKPCSSTSYVCSLCNVQVPSINHKADHERSSCQVADAETRVIVKERRSPSTSINRKITSTMNEPETAVDVAIKNDLMRSNAETGLPSSLRNAKMSCSQHAEDSPKDAMHVQNLESLNSDSASALNEDVDDGEAENLSLSLSTRSTLLPNEATGTSRNSSAPFSKVTTEKVNEKTCYVCNVQVQNADWEEHKKRKKHRSKSKQLVSLKSNAKKAKALMDKINTLKVESGGRTLPIKPNVFVERAPTPQLDVYTDESEQNAASTEAESCSNTIACDVQMSSVSEKFANEKTLENVAKIETQSVTEDQSRLNSMPINLSVVPERNSTREASLDMRTKPDFIFIDPKLGSCCYLCYLCKAKMSISDLEQHLKGGRHINNFQILIRHITNTVNLNTDVNAVKMVNQNQTVCLICNVIVNKTNMARHVQRGLHYWNYIKIFE